MRRTALALAGFLLVAACEEWHLSVNSNGLVFISVVGDAGEPRHRFRLRTRDTGGAVQILDVPAAGHLTFTPVVDGPLEVTLLPPDGCRVTGDNPRTLAVTAAQELRLAFDVRCSQGLEHGG